MVFLPCFSLTCVFFPGTRKHFVGNGSAKRLELYKVHPIHPSMIKLAEIIQQCSVEINNAIGALRNMKNLVNIREAIVRINSLENHADDIFDNAVARLFEDEKDAIQIIKIKEVLR